MRLRILQWACILSVLACIWVSRLGRHEWQGSLTTRHWIVIVLAIWSAISGFTLQRRIVNRPARSKKAASPSTAFSRWRAGHAARLWMAATVGYWALLLCEFAGPPWLVNVFFGLSLLLLLVWTPGVVPDQAA
ncbi:MAG: hypothetical protein ABSG72_10845 [Candidatus Sulfotelmatobacter sp.]